ncbi:hypothetical protein Rsub_00498 [Raphidocelis subcapitata]|uniref:PPPDE domain-containing protein n=1 Tax=Raphidocelis subcapitata TaxID=307507 RepID=A0A2V0NS75_9CHLO|nr:hypothetical protein Rsub_00498 [Raphidocelis subcapitata]|eukprot:GBF87787.1 hypothetical protein Rsub_00498 [Raphidocelis subcapitata]
MAEGTEVFLNVYDVVPPSGDEGSSTAPLTRINNITRNLFGGLGGVFHGAIVVGDVEYSFGYCESGSGVYHLRVKSNPMYTFRETISLGKTTLDQAQINAIIRRMREEWPGSSYDLLSRNCCHFCDELASMLCVDPVPAWLNRFAVTGAAAMQATNDASNTMRNVRDELVRVSGETVSILRSNLKTAVAAVQAKAATAAPEGSRRAAVVGHGAALAAHAGGALRAAAKGLHTAINGPSRPGGGGGDAAGYLPPAYDDSASLPPAPEAAAAAAVAAADAGLAGAGGSEASLASMSSHRAALPTTALRWGGGSGSFVGSGASLGLPQEGQEGAAARAE